MLESAIINGMVIMEIKLTIATVFEAKTESLPYLAANITVLLAVGALAEIIKADSRVPVKPNDLNKASITSGRIISLNKATIKILPSLKIFLISTFDK